MQKTIVRELDLANSGDSRNGRSPIVSPVLLFIAIAPIIGA